MGRGIGESEGGARKVTKMRKGLTLMELLTVISILATLAALLFPVYLKVRSRVYETSCANQLRQIGIAIHMYANDHGDGTPYSMPYHFGKLYPFYVADRDLLICPRVQALLPGKFLAYLRQFTDRTGSPRSTYWNVKPKALDILAKQHPGEFVSFAEVFAKRGDMTPIALCEFHRHCQGLFIGSKDPDFSSWLEVYCYDKRYDIFLTPGAPLLVLRWGGTVSRVFKGAYMFPDTNVFLMDY
jgi:prepilin-type N-terminal cleavage/methylation domain-containing protein